MTGFLFVLMSCGREDPCAAMCSAATRVFGGCLATWEAEWSDAGFSDERDHFHSCETWVWEMRLLENNAKKQGQIKNLGHVDGHCVDMETSLLSADMTCTAWSAIDWEEYPWFP